MCLSNIVNPLLDWYVENRRILPWREDPSPYHVWISEIMLQQTRVEAVKAYYERFMKEIPDIKTLAGVDDEKLLKLWEGLGYYNRARNLKKAANQIQDEYGGKMPSEYDDLIKLAGIGSYTAGAISSIAFAKPEAAIDGNVLRVISRVTADESDISLDSVKKSMREKINEIIPEGRAGEFNQALMDLGAMVCVPNGTPHCDMCPWKSFCEANLQNKTDSIPHKAPKKQRRIEKKTVLILIKDNKILLRKRPDKGLLAGMYEFPMVEGHVGKKEVLSYLDKQGLKALHLEKVEESKHIFSHIEWIMKAYKVRLDDLENLQKDGGMFPVNKEMIMDAYPIPSAFAAYVPYIKGNS